MDKSKKIPISPSQTGLNSAFADVLSQIPIKDLPPGPEGLPKAEKPAKRGRVILRRETAHRGGKTVVIVYDFAPEIPDVEIDDLGRRLRKACGCGGTVTDREIEIQGDQVPRLRSLLESEGFRVDGVR